MDLIKYQGLTPESADHLTEKLNGLLNDYSVFQSNVETIHWDNRLRPFLDLSQKIHILHDITQVNRNRVAEAIVSMGGKPIFQHEYNDEQGLTTANVRQIQPVHNFEEAVFSIVEASRELLTTVEDVFYTAVAYNEENTMALMREFAMQLSFAIGVFSSVRLAQMN